MSTTKDITAEELSGIEPQEAIIIIKQLLDVQFPHIQWTVTKGAASVLGEGWLQVVGSIPQLHSIDSAHHIATRNRIDMFLQQYETTDNQLSRYKFTSTIQSL